MTSRNRFAGIVVPSSVIVLLVVMATPALKDMEASDRAWEIIQLEQRVEVAARRFTADIGYPPCERSASSAGDEYMEPRYHELSLRQSMKNWRGPYLDQMLCMADNPFGGDVILHRDLDEPPASGFSLDSEDLGHGPGSYLTLTSVPVEVARLVDEYLDGKGEDAWKSQGRVEWNAKESALSILLER
ncbi:MAG TPA: hypothetical protein ENK43_11825 [Planctomycetes bacterium]|nr:hypothetical protein [Planctomycetota bacterium]